jgi:two-component system, OmpR family, response regulator
MRALLVEDDRMIADAVAQALQDAAYSVDWVDDGRLADSALERHHFEVVLLDLGLPGRDGLDVLRRLRARGDDVPVIIISARDALATRIEGLDIGADDYLVKPFQPAELLARIRAVARRRTGSAQPLLGNGIVALDPVSKIATVADVEHPLTKREYALLRELLLRPGAILSRTELEDRIYGWADEVESNVVEFIIHSLRRKLGNDVIKNVRGLGWMADRRA